jgi:hypothetical protein
VQQRQTDALRAAEAQAEANAAAADARFGQTRILAPASGIVTLRAARQGEVVNPGNPIVTLFDLSSTWVDADVEETYADLIAMGQTCRAPALRHRGHRSGDLQSGGSRFRHAARCQPHQARHQDRGHTRARGQSRWQAPLGMTAWVMLPVPALPPPRRSTA